MQPKVEEQDEILAFEQILTHKDEKVKGKVTWRYLAKLEKFHQFHAKWLEEELADTPQLLLL